MAGSHRSHPKSPQHKTRLSEIIVDLRTRGDLTIMIGISWGYNRGYNGIYVFFLAGKGHHYYGDIMGYDRRFKDNCGVTLW